MAVVDASLLVAAGAGTRQLNVSDFQAASTLAATEASLAVAVTRLTSILTQLQGTLAVSSASLPLPAGASTEATLSTRFQAGKVARTITVSAVGATVVLTPPAGQALTVYWAQAIADTNSATTPKIQIGFTGAADFLYNTFGAVAHAEKFVGAVNQTLSCTLDAAVAVALTIHYTAA